MLRYSKLSKFVLHALWATEAKAKGMLGIGDAIGDFDDHVVEQKLSTIVWTPIQYVTVYFRDVPGAALLRNRNRAEITLLMYEQKPYQ